MPHTPGPWVAKEHDDSDGWDILMGSSLACRWRYSPHHIISYDHGFDPETEPELWEEAADNARLIAAAPDLLAACERMLTPSQSTDELMRKTEAMVQAVIQAGGTAPSPATAGRACIRCGLLIDPGKQMCDICAAELDT